MVAVGYDGGDLPLADLVHVRGRHIQRADDRIEGIIHPPQQFTVDPAGTVGIGPLLQVAGCSGRDDYSDFFHQNAYLTNAVVEVYLDLVEIAVIRVGYFGRDIPF